MYLAKTTNSTCESFPNMLYLLYVDLLLCTLTHQPQNTPYCISTSKLLQTQRLRRNYL